MVGAGVLPGGFFALSTGPVSRRTVVPRVDVDESRGIFTCPFWSSFRLVIPCHRSFNQYGDKKETSPTTTFPCSLSLCGFVGFGSLTTPPRPRQTQKHGQRDGRRDRMWPFLVILPKKPSNASSTTRARMQRIRHRITPMLLSLNDRLRPKVFGEPRRQVTNGPQQRMEFPYYTCDEHFDSALPMYLPTKVGAGINPCKSHKE
jgi:hypothetical protein